MTRRRFVGGAGLAGFLALSFPSAALRLVRSAAAQALDGGPNATAALDEAAVKTLTAFGRALVPSSFLEHGAAAGDGIDGVIRATISENGVNPDFRAAAELLDEKSLSIYRIRFAELDGDRRRRLLHHIFDPYRDRTLLSSAYFYVTDSGRRVRRLWSSVAGPIIAEFYTSSFGWRVVGYPRRPGECSNLVDYQGPVV